LHWAGINATLLSGGVLPSLINPIFSIQLVQTIIDVVKYKELIYPGRMAIKPFAGYQVGTKPSDAYSNFHQMPNLALICKNNISTCFA